MRNVLLFSLVCLMCGTALAQQAASYQNGARGALYAEASHEGKDCPDAKTTSEENTCIAKVLTTTQNDFEIFYENLSALLGPMTANPQKLKEAQEQWLKYREKTCDAISFLYKGGSIQPSAATRCQIALTRSRMHELDSIYYSVLHN